MSKIKRNQEIDNIEKMIKKKSLVFVDYQGINVADFTGLRDDLRENQTIVKVFRNTLTLRVLKKLKIEVDENIFKQMTAMVIANDENFMGASKNVLKAEKGKRVKIKGGFYNGEVIDSDLVRKYASIPSQQELYGILVATLQQIISEMVFVLEEIKKQKEN